MWRGASTAYAPQMTIRRNKRNAHMLFDLSLTTTDMLIMGGMLAVFLALSVLVFFRRGG
jgi:hypothetical protein